ncbi:PspA/IM30 family protein [Brevibacillus centrosporus]|jgi:phage shock protein A|uniref:Phage shock protein A (PspA) family protein n=1 Tax=Brevibacillus centrosporus TaxID=54910 RepID=A0A1I3QLV7_9BACL|nr:PspA/IM30 family protein [Brevibacillus centrosporus]MEC2129428.1 PspA/IM30 family protein [Brevibacillus centrosporus]MED1950416.1 PspA/IM30 family protein [Brevibacillus centrosporus]RNB65567.1 PspA/IM30 family protein [Brevibacillus centrosporus]SFJ34186.1 phage shock protein A (PspA) family protein [Brevibacillus centrosporus]GED29779.1 phage shock protein A [Brevibacillus centrosporus]
MSIFRRLRDLTVASVNDALDSMEDPVVMLNQYMRDMEVEIGQVEVAVARQVALEKKFRQQWEEAVALVEKRDRQVKLALTEGEDELARRALADKKQYEGRAQEYETLYLSAAEAAGQMREKLAELKEEFYKMRAKKFTLMARAQVARTQKQVNSAVVGIGNQTAGRGFARMEEKVMRMEAEAQMSGQWRQTSMGLNNALSELEKDDLDAELANIKASLKENKASAAPETKA